LILKKERKEEDPNKSKTTLAVKKNQKPTTYSPLMEKKLQNLLNLIFLKMKTSHPNTLKISFNKHSTEFSAFENRIVGVVHAGA
jgi:hypothetical protein